MVQYKHEPDEVVPDTLRSATIEFNRAGESPPDLTVPNRQRRRDPAGAAGETEDGEQAGPVRDHTPSREMARRGSRVTVKNPHETCYDGIMDELINRARTLVSVLRTDEAIDHLVDEGVPYLDAFLAVKAAEIAEKARAL